MYASRVPITRALGQNVEGWTQWELNTVLRRPLQGGVGGSVIVDRVFAWAWYSPEYPHYVLHRIASCVPSVLHFRISSKCLTWLLLPQPPKVCELFSSSILNLFFFFFLNYLKWLPFIWLNPSRSSWAFGRETIGRSRWCLSLPCHMNP